MTLTYQYTIKFNVHGRDMRVCLPAVQTDARPVDVVAIFIAETMLRKHLEERGMQQPKQLRPVLESKVLCSKSVVQGVYTVNNNIVD